VEIDVGIKDFAVVSTKKIENPKYLKNSLARLKVLQKRVSRKVQRSKNQEKSRLQLSKLHEKISNPKK
jgi:putative transposase